MISGLAIVGGGYAVHYAQAFLQKKPSLTVPPTP
jgi:hypothetical protein